jgi:predicted lactoylglutathione lyase
MITKLDFVTIPSRDAERSRSFYLDTLGLRPDAKARFAARRELEAKGVEFTRETFDTGVCHMAFFADPDGNDLMLHHRYAARA